MSKDDAEELPAQTTNEINKTKRMQVAEPQQKTTKGNTITPDDYP